MDLHDGSKGQTPIAGDSNATGGATDGDGTETNTTKLNISNFRPILFKGNASDYFAIWLANLVLSIITLGIYSAWAKVRRINYFYNNTYLAESSLIYHANPKTILIGRIIAVVVLIGLNLIAEFVPVLSLVISPIILFALPWIMNRSMRFQARMTSWRNVRFQWLGTYWETFMWMIIAPLISILSWGLLAPWMSKLSYKYYANNHSFGTSSFSSDAKTGDYYKAFFMGAFLPFIVLMVLLCLPMLIVLFAASPSGNTEGMFIIGQSLGFAFVIAFFVASTIYSTLARNVLLNTLLLRDKVIFKSDLSAWRVLWISMSNLVAIVFTLGLMAPWAHVRLYRYLCSHTHYKTVGDIGSFIDRSTPEMSAVSEEIADLEGLEFGL